ncbi:XRE family transcriptional regulator [Bifidobacterium primatium]|uniref:XRE family transcriptional regulator n=1 Tax=Bifidobacterium primatium TaxID=2045438 RepID=A0A2M9HA66_9BIFI|nr:helix-turn-helix transcriptional regulator [Bifidobacterium primatium]PJM73705.1 XRE family transcriptional regulator [Bifidobacterium primatium]
MSRELGEKIRKLMRQYDITQAQLSDRIGVGQSSISKYLSGANEPKAETLANIATILHTTSEELLGKPEKKLQTPYGTIKEYCARHGQDLSDAEVIDLITTLLAPRGGKIDFPR